jgi:hypothetical protein
LQWLQTEKFIKCLSQRYRKNTTINKSQF